MQKIVMVAAAVALAAPALAARDCDRRGIQREGRALVRDLQSLEQLAQSVPGHRRVADEANGLQRTVARITDGAVSNAACHQLEGELREDARPQLRELRQAERQAQGQRPAPAVRQRLDRVEASFDAFAQAFQGGVGPGPGPGPGQPPIIIPVPPIPGPGQPPVIIPVPPIPQPPVIVPVPPRPPLPPPSPCDRVVGVYTGVCRATAGVTAMSFQVVKSGGACVATNATYFAPLAMMFDGASFVGAPVSNGSVAIRDTRLVVSGAGQFLFTGYNYAGRFFFQCTPH